MKLSGLKKGLRDVPTHGHGDEMISSGDSKTTVSSRFPRIAVGLVHWPVRDKVGTTVCTNVTNLDIHDIARASRTYGVEKYFIINRMREQLMFVHRVLDHWRTGEGLKFNAMRHTALTMVETAETVDQALAQWGGPVKVISTSAKSVAGIPSVSFRELREEMANSDPAHMSYFLLFGTGYGLCPEVLERCDALLEPIRSLNPEDYRHLSVRSAASICLDRLLGAW